MMFCTGGIIIIHDRPWTAEMLDKCLGEITERFYVTTLSDAVTASTPISSEIGMSDLSKEESLDVEIE